MSDDDVERTTGGSAAASRVRASVDAWEALFRAQVTLVRRFARDDVWGGRSMQEYDVLHTLSRAPGHALRLRELARSSLLTQPSLSRLVDRLESEGLVRREPVAGDRRGTAVHLTDAGLALQREIGRRHARSIDALVGGALDTEELATLERLCTRLRLAQDELPDPGGVTADGSPGV
ncbi:MarR family transcriptional regulator [Cellulomonas sp. zg-ZUI222]|uniref:MarR family transcriptional regulator n=1 Tax=Cellulomonas wangleii TaxID=2816956 RepID=A0ABX8D667_9CELL|nr:MarR family transcriptional regulator [Cellulomonas wangleii]MBO0922841.1 MarR family transcriptional regulator [Cellulomonas wangleii]MBO0925253.1 MarR family transcriptional regulator [Cellulomonas wangleii]QVI61242.1 MarR family transcriptional regulator [Cellulomonas wangleii]